MSNKGADQTARMRRLVCTFVVLKPPKTDFLASRPIYFGIELFKQLATLQLRQNCRSALELGKPYSKFPFVEAYHRIYDQK